MCFWNNACSLQSSCHVAREDSSRRTCTYLQPSPYHSKTLETNSKRNRIRSQLVCSLQWRLALNSHQEKFSPSLRMQENMRQAVVEQILEEGATTVMLRSLPASTTTSSLMTMLGLPFVGSYDFLYLPQCSRQPNRIVEMAFINFVDHSFARLAVQLFQETSTMIQSWSRTRVSQARVQGLAPNLAYFLLRFGEGAMLGPDAPLVFVNGVPASLQDQCAAQINEYAIRSAWLVIQEETQPRQRDMRSQEETQPRQRDMRSQRLPGNRAGVRDKVEPILVAPNLREDELLDLARRHEERFGFAIFRL